jgi:hypothetical protein
MDEIYAWHEPYFSYHVHHCRVDHYFQAGDIAVVQVVGC